jgi:hypothetical protein
VFLVATVPVLVLLGLVRAVALLRRGTGASWRDALGAFFIWQSTSVVVARASVLALFAKKAAFLRTPKSSEQASWRESLRANWAETTLAVLGFLGIAAALTRPTQLAGPLLAALLVFPTLGLAAAPVNSRAAQRAALPPDLQARRTTEWKRTSPRRTFVKGVAAGGGVATVAGVVAVALALFLAPAKHPVQPPQLTGPGPGAAGSASPSQSHSPSPAPSTSSPSPSPSSPTPTPTPTSTSTTPSPTPTTTSPSPSPTTSTTTPAP